MHVRDAAADDADAVAATADLSVGAARELLRDRTVRVAVEDDDVVGVVAFDARPRVVDVTRLDGDRDAMERLLEEPLSFAASEDMAVEMVVPEGDEAGAVTTDAGFADAGAGPRFDGAPTRRYRREP